MSFLDSDLLTRVHERTTDMDAANTYPEKDLEELREAGYLPTFVPTGFGGADLSLTEIAAERTALAKAAPGTALDISMRQIIVSLGRYLIANGDTRGGQILRSAVAGEVFGFGISEPGNDLVLFGSTTRTVVTADGGYSFEGTKISTFLSPIRTRLLIFGHAGTGGGPKSAFGIVHRDDEGYSIEDNWNTLGMRATQLMTTLLEDVAVPKEHILTITDPGPSVDPVIFGIFSHFEVLLATTYQDVGERTAEMATEHVATRRLVKNQTAYSNGPGTCWHIAETALIMNAIGPQIRELTRDTDEGVDRGHSRMPQLSATKNTVAETALRAVERAMRACGGSAYYNTHELSHLYHDTLAGLFQPSDQESLYVTWANLVLDPIEKTQ